MKIALRNRIPKAALLEKARLRWFHHQNLMTGKAYHFGKGQYVSICTRSDLESLLADRAERGASPERLEELRETWASKIND